MSSIEMAAFVRVAETGSFAAASEDLGLTPSAVSRLVSRIEDRLGVRLMTRTTRRLALTHEGEAYLAHAREIVAAIEAAEAEVAGAAGRPSGRIRVSTGTAFGRHQLCLVLPEFLARHPAVTVDLNVTDRQVDLVAEQVDVAVRHGPLGDSGLIARRIAATRRIVCASPAYLARRGRPAVPSDLLEHDCLVLTGPSRLARWPFRTPEGVNRLKVSGPMVADSADVLRDMAIAGLGIVRLADFMVAGPLADGRLVPLLTETDGDEGLLLTALMPPGRHRAPRIRVFVDFLVERFGAGAWSSARVDGTEAIAA